MAKANVLSDKEIKRLVTHQKGQKYEKRNIALLMTSFYLGLRAKEMSELRIDQFLDGNGNLVDVLVLRKNQTKGTKERHLYLTNKTLRKSLDEYIEERKKQDTCFGMLFRSQVNHKFSPNSMQMIFKKMYRQVGLEGCSSHSGRRSFATKMIQNGIDIKSVQILMGHSSILTTSIYVQDNPYLLADISKRLRY